MKPLKENNETYLQHLRKAMSISGLMLVGSVGAFAHSIAPFMAVNTATKVCSKVRDKLVTISVAEDMTTQVVEKYDKIPYMNTLIDWIQEYRYYVGGIQ